MKGVMATPRDVERTADQLYAWFLKIASEGGRAPTLAEMRKRFYGVDRAFRFLVNSGWVTSEIYAKNYRVLLLHKNQGVITTKEASDDWQPYKIRGREVRPRWKRFVEIGEIDYKEKAENPR